MEFLFALGIIGLAATCLGIGAVLGRDPVRTGCRAAEGLSVDRCADCPLRRRPDREEEG